MFQSTPAITGGRDPGSMPACWANCLFQSTPAITGGRDRLRRRNEPRQMGFNPRPPLLAGETKRPQETYDKRTVSIHARHYWRARRFARNLW